MAGAAAKPYREVTGVDSSLLQCILDGAVEKPQLMDRLRWLTWRTGNGKRPSVARTGEKGTTMKQETLIWKGVMERLYGENWAQDLVGVVTEEGEGDEEESDTEGGPSVRGVFTRPREDQETVEQYEARLLRAGRILIRDDPDFLRPRDQETVAIFGEIETQDQDEAKKLLKLIFFDSLTAGNEDRGMAAKNLLEARGCGIRDVASALRPESFFDSPEVRRRRSPLSAGALVSEAREGPPAVADPQNLIAEVLSTQTELLSKALEKRERPKQSVIQVSPHIQWPSLTDSGPDSKMVVEFFDKFERVCGLANDGAGMSDVEQLRVL